MILRVLMALALAGTAHAGVVYRYTTKFTGHPLFEKASGRVWVSGDQYRAELDPDPSNPRAADVVIAGEGKTRYLNLGNSTWYFEKPQVNPYVSVVGKPKVTQQIEGTETIDGRTATKHVLRGEWVVMQDLGGTKLRQNLGLTILLWTTAELPAVPMERSFLGAGYEPPPDALTKAFAAIQGMPLRLVIAATRMYEGGRPTTITTTTTFHDIQTVDVPASMFEIPKDFREQEPVVGFADPEHW